MIKRLNKNTRYMFFNVDMLNVRVAVLLIKDKKHLVRDFKEAMSDANVRLIGMKEKITEIKSYLEELPDWSKSVGECVNLGGGTIMAVFDDNQKTDPYIVIHEMCHAMQFIVRNHEIDDAETEAYLLEYLCRTVLEDIKGYKEVKTQKHGKSRE